MRMPAAAVVLLASFSWCVARAATQDPRPERTVFASRADLVVVHVSVVDKKSGLVSGLPRESFAVYEDGRRQRIDFFLNEDTPATVGLVIDASMSMHRKREALVAGGMAFAQTTHSRDEIFTVHFNERVWFGLGADQPFTSDAGLLRTALQKSPARGKTALFDGVAAALGHVERGTSQKKALVVISDGGDNASRESFEDVLRLVNQSDALIYTICLRDEYDSDADPEALERLAAASGGIAFSPRRIGDVTKVLERIARDIHSGYTIGYVPAAARGGHRNVRVDVAAPNRRELVVRARSGYGSD
jgi:Ca-activated chloride channel family protein